MQLAESLFRSGKRIETESPEELKRLGFVRPFQSIVDSEDVFVLAQEHYARSEEHLHQVIAIVEPTLGANCEQVAEAQKRLGRIERERAYLCEWRGDLAGKQRLLLRKHPVAIPEEADITVLWSKNGRG